MEWFSVLMFIACVTQSHGHRNHYKELKNEIEKENAEMLADLESVRQELLSEIQTILNGSGKEKNAIIEKILAETVKQEVRRVVSEMGVSECQSSQDDLQRLSHFAEDAEKQISAFKENMQETYEWMLELWYDCRDKEKEIERLKTQLQECKCPEKTAKIDQAKKPKPASRGNRSRDAFGLVIADSNSDNFKLMYLNSKRVRTLNSGKRNVTDIVYNHLDGRLYYSLPDSVWSSYLNGGDEVLLRNCTALCMKVSFDATLALLQYVEYNSSSREYRRCEISLYDDNGETSCEDIPYIPAGIFSLLTVVMNMNDRRVVLAGQDGGKVHCVSGYFNITELGLNDTDERLPRSGEFYEIGYTTLHLLSALHVSPHDSEKAREIITRVPVLPTSLTIDAVGNRVFIAYEHRDVIDVFDLVTETISTFTKLKKPWDASRQMCLIN